MATKEPDLQINTDIQTDQNAKYKEAGQINAAVNAETAAITSSGYIIVTRKKDSIKLRISQREMAETIFVPSTS